jgi:peptide chain release factor 2
MRTETQHIVDSIQEAFALIKRFLDWERALVRLEELNKLAEDPNLWNDAPAAQKILKERTQLEYNIQQCKAIQQEMDDNITLIELGEEAGDEASVAEGEAGLAGLEAKVKKLEIECLLSGEADGNNCFVEINSGAGGTESQDWAAMLERMYIRWGERRGFKVELMEEMRGEQAGIKSAVIKLSGRNAYGWGKTESGVHRLVRISPFDSNARRHTSFASVWVYPEVDESIDIEILDKDLRIDTYRSSGAGGQHVNTTDSAVRITHIPTNIVVACQNERSQHKNRATAMSMLKARLYEQELKKREEAANAVNATKTDNSWGHQIRSYVLHPYQLVKDLRTDVETSNTQAVLDGDLDPFMAAALAERVGNTRTDAA